MQLEEFTARSAIDRLLSVMTMLRDKEHGCPWDLEQSIESLAPFTIEEVYEVVSAIEEGDMVELEDELGDLLFQVVFYAQLAEEQGHFNFSDIADAINRKLIRRHPHVFPKGRVDLFGQKSELSADEVVVNWEAIKKIEREEKRVKRAKERGEGGAEEPTEQASSILDDVPRALPALERARKLQKRAASVGFDWDELDSVIVKLREEIVEFEEAVAAKDEQAMHSELGDILFTVVNLARHSKIESEMALRSTNQKFERRFKWLEADLASRNKSVQEANLAELEALWQQAKDNGL